MGEIQIKNTLQGLENKYIKRELKDSNESKEQLFIQLDRNENNFGFSKQVPGAINQAISESYIYTNVFGEPLRTELAHYHQVLPDNILVGNGSFELISLIAQVFLDSTSISLTATPTFAWYRAASLLVGAKVKEIALKEHAFPLRQLIEQVDSDVKLIWLCNPNNPTGTYFSYHELNDFLKEIPENSLVVVDEAYIDFVTTNENYSVAKLIHKYKKLIILRTFSKIHGLAGLRVGYALADNSIIEQLFSFKIPPNTNRLALAAARTSLKDRTHYQYVQQAVNVEKKYYYDELSKRQIRFIPSVANFIMINFELDSEEVVAFFQTNHLLVRGGKEYGYDQWVRVTIGKHSENERFFKVLDQLIDRVKVKK
ncbi:MULTISPECIES: histidinol-phosphate transaminase [unclassified Enterococcus]|uniref:histidinol-phosphate transaminase n=1 Tax=unclassified Enterococcus TaxID=2608891 RepID=UPI0015559CA3|nr:MULTISPECIES: histidinol-phosphate transaminase [unclassified Enterococcus]MBS7576577.1 histidinol-phosphate transaminase [Enterococcus sp. MMGLQ5-2]MBS7583936.1 histidinol-phosphate transaminase [Enterococcus sp. MMGLQ5-1]NPD11797.1 histidinol-phosphate transaminase [Enterococcus sp. MMGLQ5-1]NPD36414.1 histidinol-phosphate transaminase [Enterococcus sp. MMGLQ5-2]